MIPLTFKQDQLLSFLAGCERTPSFEEMKQALGLRSKSGVHRLIGALQERGFIERVPGRHRCIRVLDKPRPLPVPDRLNPLAAYDVQTLVDELIRRGAIEAMA